MYSSTDRFTLRCLALEKQSKQALGKGCITADDKNEVT